MARTTRKKKAMSPRKQPQQARSRATVDAILEGCARVLRRGGYASLTTRSVSASAGVGIGTLYDFFPNLDAIVAALVEREMGRLVTHGASLLARSTDERDPRRAVEELIRGLVAVVSADRALYRVLLREVPFADAHGAWPRAVETLIGLGRASGERLGGLVLPEPAADTWLIGRMVHQAVLEIAFATPGDPDRELLTQELGRLTARMLLPAEGAGPARRKRRSRATP